MKLNKLLQAKNVIERHASEPVAPRTAYKFLKFIKVVAIEGDFYDQKRIEIIEKHAARDENGNMKYGEDRSNVIIKDDELSTFYSEIQELLNTEVDAPDIKFSLNELEGFKLSVGDMASIDDFILEE